MSGGRRGRRIGSKGRRPTPSVDPVAVARECWDEAVASLDVDGRDVVSGAVDAFDSGLIGGDARLLVPLMKLLRNTLSVDMSVPANRAGGLPRALAFVPPDRTRESVRDHAVAWAFDRIRTADVGHRAGFLLSENACAEIVAEAFAASCLAYDLTPGSVRRIVSRIGGR